MCSSRKYPIHTLPTEGIEISRVGGGGGSLRPKQLKKCIKFNWNFQRGWEGDLGKKSLPWGSHGYFLELHISFYSFMSTFSVNVCTYATALK